MTMTIRRKIALSALVAVSLITFSTTAWAKWREVQNGTTYECEEIKTTQCTADTHGNIIKCTDVKTVKCTAISGPGSGQATMGDSGGGTTGGGKGGKLGVFATQVSSLAAF